MNGNMYAVGMQRYHTEGWVEELPLPPPSVAGQQVATHNRRSLLTEYCGSASLRFGLITIATAATVVKLHYCYSLLSRESQTYPQLNTNKSLRLSRTAVACETSTISCRKQNFSGNFSYEGWLLLAPSHQAYCTLCSNRSSCSNFCGVH